MAREDLQRAWVWQRRMPPCALRRYTPLARPYLTMSLNAPAMSGYSNTKPVSCALSGSTCRLGVEQARVLSRLVAAAAPAGWAWRGMRAEPDSRSGRTCKTSGTHAC
eukprot:363309-Chlamydomonas_euryale.AAC.34